MVECHKLLTCFLNNTAWGARAGSLSQICRTTSSIDQSAGFEARLTRGSAVVELASASYDLLTLACLAWLELRRLSPDSVDQRRRGLDLLERAPADSWPSESVQSRQNTGHHFTLMFKISSQSLDLFLFLLNGFDHLRCFTFSNLFCNWTKM